MVSPPISLRRIDRYDGQRVTYHYRSHKSERVEWETVEVYTFIGRMVQHVFPKGFQRIRYYGVQATKTFAKLKGLIQEALAKVKGIVKGAIKIIAPLTYRQRYQQSTGRDPLRCPHCQSAMEVWRIWHPTYGVIHDELEAMRRGKYASQAPRADPARKAWTNRLARRRRNTSIAARSAVKRCWSMKPSLMWPSVRPNFVVNIRAGCPRLGAQDVTARPWRTSIKSHSPPAGRYVRTSAHWLAVRVSALRRRCHRASHCWEYGPQNDEKSQGCKEGPHSASLSAAIFVAAIANGVIQIA